MHIFITPFEIIGITNYNSFNSVIKKSIGYIVLFAPGIFIFHFLEEAPGFVSWFNSHVNADITTELFWNVNISALVITLLVVLIEFFAPSFISVSLVVLWFSFLIFANVLLHITGSLVDQTYTPGLITAIFLYLPYYLLIIARIIKTKRMNAGFLAGFAFFGSLPMLIHGYMILFLGDRLF